MKLRLTLLPLALVVLAGCTNSTENSRQPSKEEIEAGIQTRLDSVDKIPNLTDAQREQMKAGIRGGSGSPEKR
jgi:outer membrane biogenesis lipoprotein LolB